MKTIKIKEITDNNFGVYGTYTKLTEPEGLNLGKAPIDFYPDLLQVSTGKGEPSFSVCRVAPRPYTIDTIERHEFCGEGILPLDGDVLIHVGPPADHISAFDQIEAYRVPRLTMVSLFPGVWHHAPFALGDASVHTLIILPKKTYENDCATKSIPTGMQIKISL